MKGVIDTTLDIFALVAVGVIVGMFIGASGCYGQDIPYKLYRVSGEDAACIAFWEKSRDAAFAFYEKEFGIKFIEVPSKKKHGRWLDEVPADFKTWQDVFHVYQARTRTTPGTITVVLAPPIQGKARRGIGGMANVNSLWSKPYLVVFTDGSIKATKIVLAHELGHVLGLGHGRRCSFMDMRALSCARINWTVDDAMRRIIWRTIHEN